MIRNLRNRLERLERGSGTETETGNLPGWFWNCLWGIQPDITPDQAEYVQGLIKEGEAARARAMEADPAVEIIEKVLRQAGLPGGGD